ncbi:Copia protein, partial [Mucuna pruriens]
MSKQRREEKIGNQSPKRNNSKMNTVRVILFLAAHFGLNLQQFDVKNVFLHEDLEEEVYMKIPPRFYSHNEKNKSPQAWFGRSAQVMIFLGYRQSQGDDEIEKLTLKGELATQFEMKELGKLKYFLGIDVTYFKQGIFISQRKYVLDLLKETGKLGGKTSRVPIEQNHRIECEERPTIKKSQYQRLSKKQIVVVRSSAEAEFQFMAHGMCEGLWMKIILDNLKVKYEGPIKLFCDNNLTISISYNPIQHDKTKHIEIDKHFIKEKLNSGLLVTADDPIGLQSIEIRHKSHGELDENKVL